MRGKKEHVSLKMDNEVTMKICKSITLYVSFYVVMLDKERSLGKKGKLLLGIKSTLKTYGLNRTMWA